MSVHRWSGWPGAMCLDCDAPDLAEQALADGWDPDTPLPEQYRNGSCPNAKRARGRPPVEQPLTVAERSKRLREARWRKIDGLHAEITKLQEELERYRALYGPLPPV